MGAEESRVPQLASGGALLPGTVNLWLRWPEAGMLRTTSHSTSEAAERTVRPWTLDSSPWAGQSKKGEYNLLSLFSLSLSLLSLLLFPSLLLSPKSFLSFSTFLLMFQFFPHIHSLQSPCLSTHHSPSNLNSGSFPVAPSLSHTQAWDRLHED